MKVDAAVGAVPAPILVQTPRTLADMMAHLRAQPLLALDTESDSLYRYYPRVCLIQVSAYADSQRPGSGQVVDYLVDTLRLKEPGVLGELLADPHVEVVLHAAENDILTLQRDFSFTVTRVFDTQLAARVLGWRRVGLAAILKEQFGVISDKRMQRTNWGQRPLTPEQMTYAQLDTHYLLTLRRRLIGALKEARRWEEAQEAFARLSQVEYVEKERDEQSFWSMKSVREVPREKTGVLQELWLWREQTARQLDRPPFKVVNDHVLAKLVNREPTGEQELCTLPGLSQRQVQRFGRELLLALRRGQSRPLPDLPDNGRDEALLDPSTQACYEGLRRWRTATAQRRGVDPDIVFSNDILLAIAQRAPRSVAELESIPAIGPWKARTYGSQILTLLNSTGNTHVIRGHSK